MLAVLIMDAHCIPTAGSDLKNAFRNRIAHEKVGQELTAGSLFLFACSGICIVLLGLSFVIPDMIEARFDKSDFCRIFYGVVVQNVLNLPRSFLYWMSMEHRNHLHAFCG